MSDLDSARLAKDRLREMLADDERVVGVGVGGSGEQGYVVKVNLRDESAADVVPASVDDVPVVTEIVGTIHPLEP